MIFGSESLEKMSLRSPISSIVFSWPSCVDCVWDRWREREWVKKTKESKANWMARRPFFMIVCTAQIRPLPGCILNEEGLHQTHTRKVEERHWPWPWFALLLNEWLPKLGTGNTSSYLCGFNATPFLTHHAHWKLTQLCQTHTFLFSSQCKQSKKKRSQPVWQDTTAAYKTILVRQIRISLTSCEAVISKGVS